MDVQTKPTELMEVQVCYSRLVLVKRFLQLMNQVNMQHEREN